MGNIFANPFTNIAIFYLLLVWSLVWKGIALWRAAKYEQRNWFIGILALNTVSIVEIIYLFRFAKHKLTFAQIKDWIGKINIKKGQAKK